MSRIALAILLCISFSSCDKRKPGEAKEMVLNQRIRTKVQTLDPAIVGDTSSDGVCKEFYECLYQYHYLKRPYELICQLAAKMPDISPDGTVYTIKIRDDVYFHDDRCFEGGKGRKLTANDFVYAWKRIADIKTKSSNWYFLEGRIKGLDEFREYTKTCRAGQVDYWRPVEGLYAADDFTIIVKLSRPWPQFIFWLAHLPTAPMAREAVDFYGEDIVKHPVGTGPFILKQWHRGVFIEAVKNQNYYPVFYPSEGMPEDVEAGLLKDAGKRVPFADRVIWRIMEEDQPRWLLLMKGEIDLNSIPKDNFGQAVSFGHELTPEMKQLGMKLVTADEPCTFWLGMNMNDPVLGTNKPLRYAVNYAVDRARFIDLLWNGRGHHAYGLIPPVMKEYDASLHETSPSVYNPEKARQYLKQALEYGQDAGDMGKKEHGRDARATAGGKLPRLKLALGGTDTFYRQMGQFLQRNLKDAGIEVEVELFDWPTFLERLRTGDLQLFFAGWMADYPDAESFLQVFYSKNAPWPNSSYYSNPEFDAIYEKASIMQDSSERTELYRRAERIVLEDMPCAFTYHRIGYIIHHDWLNNLKPDGYKSDTIGYGYLKYYRIDTEKRDNYRKLLKRHR